MRHRVASAFVALGLVLGTRGVAAQTTIQVVGFAVAPSMQVAIQGGGASDVSVSSSGQVVGGSVESSWSISTNQVGAKISASISGPLPKGVAISAELAAPKGAMSAGLRELGPASVDLITDLSKVTASGLGLTYQLRADRSDGVLPQTRSTVTYTLTGGG